MKTGLRRSYIEVVFVGPRSASRTFSLPCDVGRNSTSVRQLMFGLSDVIETFFLQCEPKIHFSAQIIWV